MESRGRQARSGDARGYCIFAGEPSRNDALAAARLFVACVHKTNSTDYSERQLNAWAPKDEESVYRLAGKIESEFAILAKAGTSLLGFGTLSPGCEELDMLFVAPDEQRRGIGTHLAELLEQKAREEGNASITVRASLTARPFFESIGYEAVRKNKAMRAGVGLQNWIMKKRL